MAVTVASGDGVAVAQRVKSMVGPSAEQVQAPVTSSRTQLPRRWFTTHGAKAHDVQGRSASVGSGVALFAVSVGVRRGGVGVGVMNPSKRQLGAGLAPGVHVFVGVADAFGDAQPTSAFETDWTKQETCGSPVTHAKPRQLSVVARPSAMLTALMSSAICTAPSPSQSPTH